MGRAWAGMPAQLQGSGLVPATLCKVSGHACLLNDGVGVIPAPRSHPLAYLGRARLARPVTRQQGESLPRSQAFVHSVPVHSF